MKNILRAVGLMIPVTMFALVIAAAPAFSQTRILATCGTNLPGNYPTGSTGQPLTMDPTGVLCTSSGGGGGGGAVTMASGAVASGAYSAGAYAAGAVAAGAFAAGSGVDGWDLTQGARADAAWTTGAGSVISLLKAIAAAEIVTNRAVNVAQINGVAPLMGNGATGTGSHRVTLSNDSTIPTGWPTAALQTTGNSSLSTIATNSGLPLPAQTGIGNVNLGAVQSAGSMYETVAASQTAQVLGPTGATGDYLSHCVIYPTSTSPGVVTVFDDASAAGTNVITFAGGATSTSNLVPISVPIGAISTAGAWKATTGANVSITCYGKFT